MTHSSSLRTLVLLLPVMLTLSSIAQQIPCPVISDFTNNSLTAYNQLDCEIDAILDNATPGILTNRAGGDFNLGTITNESLIVNQPGANIDVGHLNNSGTILNNGLIDNRWLRTFDNSGTVINAKSLNNIGTKQQKHGRFVQHWSVR